MKTTPKYYSGSSVRWHGICKNRRRNSSAKRWFRRVNGFIGWFARQNKNETTEWAVHLRIEVGQQTVSQRTKRTKTHWWKSGRKTATPYTMGKRRPSTMTTTLSVCVPCCELIYSSKLARPFNWTIENWLAFFIIPFFWRFVHVRLFPAITSISLDEMWWNELLLLCFHHRLHIWFFRMEIQQHAQPQQILLFTATKTRIKRARNACVYHITTIEKFAPKTFVKWFWRLFRIEQKTRWIARQTKSALD